MYQKASQENKIKGHTADIQARVYGLVAQAVSAFLFAQPERTRLEEDLHL